MPGIVLKDRTLRFRPGTRSLAVAVPGGCPDVCCDPVEGCRFLYRAIPCFPDIEGPGDSPIFEEDCPRPDDVYVCRDVVCDDGGDLYEQINDDREQIRPIVIAGQCYEFETLQTVPLTYQLYRRREGVDYTPAEIANFPEVPEGATVNLSPALECGDRGQTPRDICEAPQCQDERLFLVADEDCGTDFARDLGYTPVICASVIKACSFTRVGGFCVRFDPKGGRLLRGDELGQLFPAAFVLNPDPPFPGLRLVPSCCYCAEECETIDPGVDGKPFLTPDGDCGDIVAAGVTCCCDDADQFRIVEFSATSVWTNPDNPQSSAVNTWELVTNDPGDLINGSARVVVRSRVEFPNTGVTREALYEEFVGGPGCAWREWWGIDQVPVGRGDYLSGDPLAPEIGDTSGPASACKELAQDIECGNSIVFSASCDSFRVFVRHFGTVSGNRTCLTTVTFEARRIPATGTICSDEGCPGDGKGGDDGIGTPQPDPGAPSVDPPKRPPGFPELGQTPGAGIVAAL